MYSSEIVAEARRLHESGMSPQDVVRFMALPQRTVHHWCTGTRRRGPDGRRRTFSTCPRCTDTPLDRERYSYLLGMYLGDGHIMSSQRTQRLCLFPQHGPGMKHRRAIILQPWQDEIVREHPGSFVKGLFHSDGCRTTNRTRRVVAGVEKVYEYPRWMFSNKSEDILRLCESTLELLGIAYRRSRYDHVSVSRREAVETMDRVVGPKT